jgi:hypothetical protein
MDLCSLHKTKRFPNLPAMKGCQEDQELQAALEQAFSNQRTFPVSVSLFSIGLPIFFTVTYLLLLGLFRFQRSKLGCGLMLIFGFQPARA